MQDKDVNIAEIADLISQDAAISGLVLKTINSPAFGMRRKFESIQHASVLLGLENIKNLVIASALKHVFETNQPAVQMIWEDVNAVAQCAVWISSSITSIANDEAYLAGLFHKSGALLMAKRFSDYDEVLRVAKSDPGKWIEEEERRYGTNHAIIGFILAESWKLPEIICLTILHHPRESCSEIEDEKLRSLIATIKVANYILDTILLRESTTASDTLDFFATAIKELALSSDEIEALKDQMTEFIFSK
ncbi:MAG: HDOD domain-containing protein [Gammaproteobacteria bacterium (ex Lamellibrachia satsuma)]|nr:MAG: HDOD domain-containing protein [Gammaproteobacteria bacterium (ex Lamellibrachia satsuma)]